MDANATGPIDYNAPLSNPVPYVGPIFGPFLIGVCMNCLLYGVLALQVLIYYMSYKKDPKWIRCFVFYLFFAETVNLGTNIATIYEPLVIRFGTIGALTFFPIMITATPTTNVAISTPVQIFTAWRIVVLTGKKWLGALITTFALLSLGCAIWTATVITTVRVYSRKEETVKPATVWFAASVAADVTITLGIYFSLSRRKTGFKSTDAIINRIIRLTLQTGLLTLGAAAAEIIIFIVFASNTSNFAIDFPLAKLYSNALLSTLNARLRWRTLGGMESQIGEEEDNVLFGKPEESGLTTNRSYGSSGLNKRVVGRGRGALGTRGTTSLQFVHSYELQSRDSTRNGEDSILPITVSKNVNVTTDTETDYPSTYKYGSSPTP